MVTNVLKEITINNDKDDITINKHLGPGDVPPPRAGLCKVSVKSLNRPGVIIE